MVTFVSVWLLLWLYLHGYNLMVTHLILFPFVKVMCSLM